MNGRPLSLSFHHIAWQGIHEKGHDDMDDWSKWGADVGGTSAAWQPGAGAEGWWDPDEDANTGRPVGRAEDWGHAPPTGPAACPAEIHPARRVEVVGAGPLLLAAAAGAVAATGLGVLVLLLGGVLVALVFGGLVLLGAGALAAAYLRGGRS